MKSLKVTSHQSKPHQPMSCQSRSLFTLSHLSISSNHSVLYKQLFNTLSAAFEIHGENIELIVAYSGGVDSQVLLHALVQLKQQNLLTNEITVCHVNHGLSHNAKRWQNFAEQECKKLAVNYVVKCVSVKPTAQQSLEAVARDARYEALKSLRNKKSLVLTGHHSDDQTETFLLALKRGAGLKGLSAMAAQTELGQHLLIRPLLNLSRAAIEQYASEHTLSWIEDESNTDSRFDRNFIRHEIMPLLRDRWPSINNTINRSASHCSQGQTLLDELAQQDLTQCSAENNGLHVDKLMSLSTARFNNLIRYYISAHPQYDCLMPSTEQVQQVREQLQAADDKVPQIKVADHFFRRFKGILYLTADYQDISTWFHVIELVRPSASNNVNSAALENVSLPDKLGQLVFSIHPHATDGHFSGEPLSGKALSNNILPAIRLPAENQRVTIRFTHNNPKCLPHFRQQSRSMKKVLQELSIAPWLRKRIAFLYYDEALVCAIGYFVCQPFIATDEAESLKIKYIS